ncbi:MAG TPA: flagellar biosynthetic protein FliO [Bryobacteraceae bacterium]|nr:flagellar biosynthetic protein FliO [Bryobacteraceae bacterium]
MGALLLRLFRQETKQMQTIERLPLGGQHAMHLVRVGEKLLLVVTGPGCCEVREVE